jgi:RNase P/RNase MRP subunit p30
MACAAAEIGFSLVGVTFNLETSRETRLGLMKIFGNQGLDAVSRIDLKPRNRKELLRSLREVRGAFDIVAVECSNSNVSAVAFRDRRIDLVFFSLTGLESRLRWLMPRRSKRVVELSVSDLLVDNSLATAALNRALNLIEESQRRQMPILLSSGATNATEMRTPRDMAAILSTLHPENANTMDSVTHIPFSLVHHALERRRPGFVAEGVCVVKTNP